MSALQDNGVFKWKQRSSAVFPTRDTRKVIEVETAKHNRLVRFLFLAAIPSLIVVIQNIVSLKQNAEAYNTNAELQDNVLLSIDIGKLVHCLQIERGTTAMYVSTTGDPFILQRLGNLYKATDVEVRKLSSWFSEKLAFYLTSRHAFQDYLKEFRSNLDPKNLTLHAAIQFYTRINANLIEAMGTSINLQAALSFWTDLSAYSLLIFGKEQAGIERALGSTYYARGQLPQDDLLWYNEKAVLGENFMSHSALYSPYVRQLFNTMFRETQLAADIKTMRREITANVLMSTSIRSGTIWFDNMTEYINILKEIQDKLAHRIIVQAKNENDSLRNSLVGGAVQLVVAFITLPIITILVQNVVIFTSKIRKNKVTLTYERKHTEKILADLDEERIKTEELLNQLMPKCVLETMTEHGCITPEYFDAATVMFTNVVGFTRIANCSTPIQIVQMLNKIYMTMDKQIDHYDVYKVDTIGDAYMIVSGVPEMNGDRHVVEIAKLSINLINTLESVVIPHKSEEYIKLRIGFDTGPCTAGVVGHKLPRYCLFGDVVNIASHMESTSLPLRIQMSQASAELLKLTTNDYIIKQKGPVEVKGKGLIQTFWLEGNRNMS